jgi:putative peptide zinc metalloprotease protein
MSHFRRLTLFLLALVVALSTGLARPDFASADEGGSSPTNAAIAINTNSGSSVFKFAFSIRRVAGDVVDHTNAAVAYSSCESCQTTAIAIQIVLVTGNPSVVTPQNLALALNENCTLCETFAGAYQIVLGTGGAVKLTSAGKQRIMEVRREISRLRREDLSPFELKARLDELVGQLKEVLRTELVPTRDGDEDDEELDEQVEEEEPLERPPQTATTGTTETAESTTTTTTTASTTTTTAPTTTAETTTTTTP